MGCEHSITSKPKGEHPITGKPSGAHDCSWNPGAYSLSGPHIQGDFHSYPQDLNFMPDSKFDGDLINVKSEMSEFYRESELYPEVNTRGLDYAIDGCNLSPSNCLMNTNVNSMDYGNSEAYMNCMPPTYKSSTCYPIKEHGAEAKNSTTSRFQRSGIFSSSECSTSLYNFGKSATKNDINIGPPSFSKPPSVDGNFLTLGIGSVTEVRPSSNFSTREISSTLEKASFDSQYNNSIIRHCPKNPMNRTQLMGRSGRVQTSAGGLSIPSHEYGLIGDTGCGLNFIPSHGLQTNVQPNFSANEFGSSPLSLPFGNTLVSTHKHGPQPGLMSANYSSQPIAGQQDYRRESSMNVSCESSRNLPSHRHNHSPISHLQLGRLIPLTGEGAQINASVNYQSVQPARNLTSTASSIRTEAAKIGSFASSVHPVDTHNVDPVEELGNYYFPERNEFRNSKSGNSQLVAGGPFPKRLGLQSDDFVTAGKSDDFVTAGTSRGPPPFHLASSLNPVRPSAYTGQYQHVVAAESSKDSPRVNLSNGQVIPVAKLDVKPQVVSVAKLDVKPQVVSHSSLKRKATKPPSTARLGQPRKIFSQHSAPSQTQSIQTTPRTVNNPSTPHVKWQGFDDERLRPHGEKCLLCKRDLSFTPEGLVFQPTAPPPVAVLPCGHTFHDRCLQIITPKDQLNSPPCIPCAIGGT